MIAVLTIVVTSAARLCSADVIDLRDGVRTYLYAGGVGDAHGWAIALGDVDGDGFMDLLSSSANSDGPNDEHGPEKDVYLIFGRSHAEIDSVYLLDAPSRADIVFYRGGFAIACADIDRDGYDDLVLAEHDVNVLFGRPRQQFLTEYNFKTDSPYYTPPDIHIIGSIRLGGAVVDIQNFGYDSVIRSLVSGDINGDGFADVAIGNHIACDPPGTCVDGAAYVIFGRPRAQFPPVVDVDYSSNLAHPDVLILGDSNEGYPTNLAIGDLDGDSVDDLLASTGSGWGAYNMTPGIGEIHGWWGRRDWRATYDTQIDDFDFSFQGTAGSGGYALGYRMETGDLDGDGRDELVVGSAYGYSATLPVDRSIMGEYRVFFGRPRALWPRWSNAVDMTDILILGAMTGDALSLNGPLEWGICFSLATGNRDGDEFDDLLLGAGQLHHPDGSRPGGAYLLRGRPRSEWEPFIDLRDDYDMIIHGVDYTGSPGYQFDRLGFVTAMGDIDGNNKDEMFVAAPFADGPNNSIPDCGEIYVIYDSDVGTPTASVGPRVARAALSPNYPNPFNALTTFRVQAPSGEAISLTVYDALGREVARPVVRAPMTSAEMEFVWTALDENGRTLPSGVYFVKLRAGNEAHARKVLLVR